MLGRRGRPHVDGKPARYWRLCSVERWTEHDQIRRASIDRAFGVGAVIKSKAKGFPTSTLVVTAVDRPQLWVDESRLPGLTMTFQHAVDVIDSGTRITERVNMSGTFARLFAPIIRRRLLALMAASTEHVAARAVRAGP